MDQTTQSVKTVLNKFPVIKCLPQSLGQAFTVTQSFITLLRNCDQKVPFFWRQWSSATISPHVSPASARANASSMVKRNTWTSASCSKADQPQASQNGSPQKTKTARLNVLDWSRCLVSCTAFPKLWVWGLLHIVFPTWRPHAICKPLDLLD